MEASPAPIDPEAILQAEINRYVQKGFRVVSQTPRSAQLVKTKKFSCLFAILGILIIYLIYYMAKRDKQVYLTVDEQGQISRR